MYEVLKNRLTNGKQFLVSTALARIEALANNLEVTQEQADELTTLAKANGMPEISTVEERLNEIESAVMELATMLAGDEPTATEVEING